MSASNFCCTHPQQRTDSPEPPPRPLASIDGIFAAAALPEDHPHALKFPEKKPELDASIFRSLNVANKIRLQFCKRSMKSLSKEDDYDDDAHRVTSQKVLEDVAEASPKDEHNAPMTPVTNQHHRFGSVRGSDKDKIKSSPAHLAQSDVRTSVLKTGAYLQPFLLKPSEFNVSGESYNVVDVATRVAARHELFDIANENGYPLPSLPKSLSSPMPLQGVELAASARPRRSRSEFGLGDPLSTPKTRPRSYSNFSLPLHISQHSSGPAALTQAIAHEQPPTVHVQEPSTIDSVEPDHVCGDSVPMDIESKSDTPAVDDGIHLHKMDIHAQLRSMSQLSDPVEEDSLLASPCPLNSDQRYQSDVGAARGRSQHSRHKSSSGLDSETLPTSWGRVRSPVQDATSSLYSRPCSSGANATDTQGKGRDIPPYEIPNDLNALFADWPLKPLASTEETHRGLEAVSERSAGSERRNKPLPPTPADSRKESGTASFVTATNKDEGSLKWLSPPQRDGSLPSKSSSSILTKDSKRSRFLERFSPPKKIVRKRRSIFRFLRPGSRKQQARSVSTPVLSTKSSTPADTYDGPSDDPALLMVHYELDGNPIHANRSMSMSKLGPGRHSDGASQLAIPHNLQRRPTMAEYEKNLSVIGDDRRRPSAVNIQRVKDIQEDDRRQSEGLRRKLSRAHPLNDDISPLMAHALEKHQQEKALFRSASKQRESVKGSDETPVFSSSPFSGSRVPSITQEEHSDLLDPLEKGNFANSSARGLITSHLLHPDSIHAGSSRRVSITPSSKAVSTKVLSAEPFSSSAESPPAKIGTSLASWSRYPSHTRFERCGSAGLPDAVITRDFAIDINPEEIHATDEIGPGSPESKPSGKYSKAPLPKSRSMTFSGIVRYYSNFFHTSGFSGQNRRTSVTTAGRLEYPELEMLPPQLSTDLSSHTHHLHDELERIKEHVKEDANKIRDYVKKEEDKLGDYVRREEGELEGYVRKEEDKFEGFVRKEEEKFEGFVRREEDELKEYIKEEEDKLLHHHQHHRAASKDVPFSHEDNIFQIRHHRSHDNMKRRDTMIGPNDDPDEESPPSCKAGAESGLGLDGATTNLPEAVRSTPSKAQLWSDVYRECLLRPGSVDPKDADEMSAPLLGPKTLPGAIGPPALKSVKPRSPEQLKQLDPKATIRRFPSVTVIDDRKGHIRSVSFISVKSSRSGGFERSSTHNLLEVIKAREHEECEKLLSGVSS